MTRARDLARLGNRNIITADTNFNVGIGSLTPDAKLDVAGIVSATAFYGDGSNLEGVASAGLGTALGDTGAATVIYYTDNILSIGSTITIDPPSSTNVAYTQYAEIAVDADADLIVADGDDFIPDILGIGSDVQQPGLLAGGGGRVRADNFTNKAGTGAPTFSSGVVVTGVATATSFSGDLTGNVTGNVTGNATGLSGTPDITVNNVVAGVVTATSFEGSGSGLTGLNIPVGFNELDATLFN